jgi:DNA modification methylase
MTNPVIIGDAVLYLGDCREILPTLGRVDAVVTDPPYGVNFKGKATKHTQASKDFSGGYIGGDTDIGPVVVAVALAIADRGVVFPGSRLMFDYPKPYEIGCVYCPSGAGLGRWGFTVQHPILFYGMGMPHTRQGPSGFESFDTVEDCGHPCPKPIRWMEWAVKKCSVAAQTILDPFMGSGTTGVACAKLGRKFIGIEIEPKYFDIACRRIEAAYAQPDMFVTPPPKPVQEALI